MYTDPLLSGDLLALILASPILYEVIHGSELLAHHIGLSSRLVHLIDGKDDRHTGKRGVRDGLLGLRHDTIIGCDDDDDDIRYLGSASTHSSKGLVTGSIDECELASPLEGHPIGTDVLGDAARLTGDDVGLAHGIEERGLTMIDVTHHSHYRCTRLKILRLILLSLDRLHSLGIDILRLVPILVKDKVDLILLQTLVDGDHEAEIKAVDDDVIDGDVKHLGEVIDGDELSQLELLALALLCSQ